MQQRVYATSIIRVVATAAGSFLILLPLLFLLNLGARAADDAAPMSIPDSASADCLTVGNVPTEECMALVALYSSTTGVNWITNTNWLQFDPDAPCGWYGVSCAGGHVTEVLLAGNGLSGTLPLMLGNLRELTRLRLENNAIFGRIPPPICGLTKLVDLNLAYNAFFTLRRTVEACLATLDPDWLATQTNAVTNLRLTEILTDSIRFDWTPISYTGDGGYYEIGIANHPDGPYTMHGQTLDKSASAYVVDGLEPGRTYFVRVRSYTPAHGDQPSDVRGIAAQGAGVTQALSGRVLVSAYFGADNDLSTEIPYVIERMRRGTFLNPNVQIVLLVDGSEDGDSNVLEISKGVVVTTSTVVDEWGIHELNSADPEVLAWFLKYARNKFPSERNVAAIIGHGIAQAPEVEWPELAMNASVNGNAPFGDVIPALPKEHEYTPSDVTNRGYMSVVDVGRALREATENGAKPFDVLFFDQCFQGNLDGLYEVRNTARTYVASPNYAWLVAAYDRYLGRFLPNATPAQMAQGIIDNYEGALDPRHPNAIFWISNGDLFSIAAQVSLLADALKVALLANEQDKIARAVQQSQYVDTTQCGRTNLELRPPDELIGIEGFGTALMAEFGAGDPYGVSSALTAMQPFFANLGKRAIFGSPYLAPTERWEYGNSLTILAPLPRNSPSDVAWRASIYRSDMPFTATWSALVSQPVTVTESLAYVRDAHWDEFLAEWYLDLTPTVGQWCQYIPPVQVLVSETEELSLTVSAVTTDSLQLNWTPTDDSSAIEYWLYLQEPFDIGWRMDRAIPLNETGLALSNLEKGDYDYKLVARNDEEQVIAQSNEVSATLTGWTETPEPPLPPEPPIPPKPIILLPAVKKR